jgi:hypothetical protein
MPTKPAPVKSASHSRQLAGLVLLAIATRGALAEADDAPTTAIRIEAKDPESTKRATELTKALRTAVKGAHRAKASAGDVDAMVRDGDCSILQPACAAAIGAKLGVSHVLVGQLEKRGSRYTLTASLISVRTKQRVRSLRDVSGASANVRKWANTVYTKMLDEGTGEVTIVANARRGQVFVDGLAVTELYEGRATLSGIALGTHGLEIRAAGYRPLAVDITVDGNSEESFLLDPLE